LKHLVSLWRVGGAALRKYLLAQWYDQGGRSPPWSCRLLAQLTLWYIRFQKPLNRQPYRAPVIVVGNITVGGTGKTPFIIELAKHLKAMGWSPGIICRGDGGLSTPFPRRVEPDVSTSVEDKNDWNTFGDEARLHAYLGMPVWEGHRRHDVAMALLSHHPEVDIVLSDDGLQHRALFRTIECVLVSASLGLGNGYVLPAGPLREPKARLNQVDALIIHRSSPDAPDHLSDVPGFALDSAPLSVPHYWTTLQLGEPIPLKHYFSSKKSVPLQENVPENARSLEPDFLFSWSDWASRSRLSQVVAVSAIAMPKHFFDQLIAKGVFLSQARSFPDHYRLKREDFSGQVDAFLVTEKDAVKCMNYTDLPIWVVPSWIDIPEAFLSLLKDRLLPFKKVIDE
jgi:tetraacyldisaccharide 4'-kinase